LSERKKIRKYYYWGNTVKKNNNPGTFPSVFADTDNKDDITTLIVDAIDHFDRSMARGVLKALNTPGFENS